MDKVRQVAVIGWPIEHSLSPRLHQYWLNHYGIKGTYQGLAVQERDLEQVVRGLADRGLCGGNVTIPYKERVMPFLDSVDETAAAIGAVNTIIIKNDKLHGTNTDAYGFMQNLKNQAKLKTKKAVVLGAGGAARAVCYALQEEGFKNIVLTNRTHQKAEELATHFGKSFGVVAWEDRSQALEDTTLLVNTTSLGLEKNPPLDIDLAILPKEAVVTDIIYNPLVTPLLAAARARGNITVDGLGMLMHQAVPGFAAWFGKTPQVTTELRSHLMEAL